MQWLYQTKNQRHQNTHFIYMEIQAQISYSMTRKEVQLDQATLKTH